MKKKDLFIKILFFLLMTEKKKLRIAVVPEESYLRHDKTKEETFVTEVSLNKSDGGSGTAKITLPNTDNKVLKLPDKNRSFQDNIPDRNVVYDEDSDRNKGPGGGSFVDKRVRPPEIRSTSEYQTNPMYEKLLKFRQMQEKKRFTVEDLLKW